jgi:rhodanese-related sulfurtransferase
VSSRSPTLHEILATGVWVAGNGSSLPSFEEEEGYLRHCEEMYGFVRDHCQAYEGQPFGVIFDVRPEDARKKNPFPGPCVGIYADDLIDQGAAEVLHVPVGSVSVCCCCWNGARAFRAALSLRLSGWDAYWWAMSPAARAVMEED